MTGSDRHARPPGAAASDYLEFACQLAELAGERVLPYFRQVLTVDNKAAAGGFDPVTAADRAAEHVMRAEITAAFPEHGILGEEHGQQDGSSGLTWVLDPIDGTRSFILGQLHWGVLVALNDGNRPIVGVMHQPYVGETFTGAAGAAEWRRGEQRRRLRTRACARLDQAVLTTTHPDVFATRAERAAFDLLASRARLARYGGDCYSYCLLAMGLVDAVIESTLQPYDVQALIPIVEGAGGRMTTWAGEPAYQGGQVVAAGDPTLHRAVLEVLAWGRADA